MFKLLCISLFFVAQVSFASTPSNISSLIKFKVDKFKLKNGLSVLLYEDHSAPTISYHTWFRVGSKNEQPGLTGIAHLFEHMMFKGAKRYSGKDFDNILRANGASNNAFTSHDYTGYYIDLPSDKLELMMDIESDRMVNLQVTEANLKSEREVVKEERRLRVENSIRGSLNEAVYNTAYKVHPYRWPVVGWMKDLNNIKVEDCRKFYKANYAPNNAVLVIAGDFDPVKTKALINKYYGSLEASQDLSRPPLPVEPNQTSERNQIITKDVQSTTVSIVYKISKAGDEESYALDLLSNILGKGDSSRLYRRLVYQEQLANSVSVWSYTPQDNGLFQIEVSLRPGADLQRVLKSIYGELWRARTYLLSDKEIEKAKNQTMTDYVNSLKTIHGKANLLAVNETLFADYNVLFKDLDIYNRMKKEDLKAVAKKYLQPYQRSIVRVVPKKGN